MVANQAESPYQQPVKPQYACISPLTAQRNVLGTLRACRKVRAGIGQPFQQHGFCRRQDSKEGVSWAARGRCSTYVRIFWHPSSIRVTKPQVAGSRYSRGSRKSVHKSNIVHEKRAKPLAEPPSALPNSTYQIDCTNTNAVARKWVETVPTQRHAPRPKG